jgi:hypothetical protein
MLHRTQSALACGVLDAVGARVGALSSSSRELISGSRSRPGPVVCGDGEAQKKRVSDYFPIYSKLGLSFERTGDEAASPRSTSSDCNNKYYYPVSKWHRLIDHAPGAGLDDNCIDDLHHLFTMIVDEIAVRLHCALVRGFRVMSVYGTSPFACTGKGIAGQAIASIMVTRSLRR